MANFKKDLETGKIYEYKSVGILKKYGFYDIIVDGTYNSYYDITAYKDNKKVYIECKYNSLTDKTGYIFLECCTRSLDVSGRTNTKADYYIFFSNTKYYICGVEKVKNILRKTIRKALKKVKVIKPTRVQLCDYIAQHGIKTNNTIGVLISVHDVIKKSKYTGVLIQKLF